MRGWGRLTGHRARLCPPPGVPEPPPRARVWGEFIAFVPKMGCLWLC